MSRGIDMPLVGPLIMNAAREAGREVSLLLSGGVRDLVKIENDPQNLPSAQRLHLDGEVLSFLIAGPDGRHLDRLALKEGEYVRERIFIEPWQGYLFSGVHGGSAGQAAEPAWHGVFGLKQGQDILLAGNLTPYRKFLPEFSGEMVEPAAGDPKEVQEAWERFQAPPASEPLAPRAPEPLAPEPLPPLAPEPLPAASSSKEGKLCASVEKVFLFTSDNFSSFHPRLSPLRHPSSVLLGGRGGLRGGLHAPGISPDWAGRAGSLFAPEIAGGRRGG